MYIDIYSLLMSLRNHNTSFLNTFRYLDILNSVVIILRIENDVWSPTDNRVQF